MLLAETGSIGVRRSNVERTAADRRIDTVDVDGQSIRIKVTPHRHKAEHDDVVQAATVLDRPARDVAAQAEAAWRSSDG